MITQKTQKQTSPASAGKSLRRPRRFHRRQPARHAAPGSTGRLVRHVPQRSTVSQPIPQLKKGVLRIVPLGGMEEVGRNMTVFEYGNDIVILDMGMQFPEEDMPGIDYIIPNISYLKGKEKNIRGVIFSHGHLDHIGAAPILLEQLGYPPIIGRDLTVALIKKRLEDYSPKSAKNLKIIRIKSIDDRLSLGDFRLRFFNVEHSIMDAVGVVLNTPTGTIIHPGDWTMEKNPLGHAPVTYHHLANLPRPKILMLESFGAIDTRTGINNRRRNVCQSGKVDYRDPGKNNYCHLFFASAAHRPYS